MMTTARTVSMAAAQDDKLDTVPIVVMTIVPANMSSVCVHMRDTRWVMDIVTVAAIVVVVHVDRKAAEPTTGAESHQSRERDNAK